MAKQNFRYVLTDYEKLGGTSRRYRNVKTGETISRREFVKRASKVPFKPKEKLTIHDKRVRWYTNHVNKELYEDGAPSWDYISFDEAERSPDFRYYEGLIRSRYDEDRDLGYEYFRELEEEYADQDWGETP